MRAAAAAAAALALSIACSAPRRIPPPPDPEGIIGLELTGEFNIPPLTSFDALKSARFGGVSGLATDPASGELLGVSDDREASRVFVFKVRRPGTDGPFRVDLHSYFPLPPAAEPAEIDPEGIATATGGRVFVASEGVQNRQPRLPPAVLEYTRNYHLVQKLQIPAKFIPPATGRITHGVRENASFESLTITPGGERLYTATESPLVQDGPAATIKAGALVRVLEFEKRDATFDPGREFVYPIEPLGPLAFEPRFSVTGLVELLSLGGLEFLAMERGYAESEGDNPRRTNRIRIFRMSLEGATDVSASESIAGVRPVPARKSLLLDLSTVTGLSPALADLDNFEGMTWGPVLQDGSRTLLLVSDDNFNRRQITSFLLFRVVER